MEFWIDTIHPEKVKELKELGLLYGVTTNPSLINDGNNAKDTLTHLLDAFDGPLAVQVISRDANSMIEEGKALYNFSNRIIVKIPVTREGLRAISELDSLAIPVMATCIFSPDQALLAAKAGADYVAPYLTRLENAGGDIIDLLSGITSIFANYHIETKVLAASVSSLEQFQICAEFGAGAITLNDTLYGKLLQDHPLTLDALNQFDKCLKAEDASLFRNNPIV